MTLMPSRHVRDPRRRYRANKIRKRDDSSVPPPVVQHVSPELIAELVKQPPQVRTKVLLRIEQQHGTAYVEAVIRVLAKALRETRKK